MNVHVGVARLDLHMPEAQSLKGRRAVLNKARAALTRDLGVSVAQVDDTQQWQQASLAVACVASSPAGVDRVLDRVVAVVERDPRVVVVGQHARHLTTTFDETTVGGAAGLREVEGLSVEDEALLAEFNDMP